MNTINQFLKNCKNYNQITILILIKILNDFNILKQTLQLCNIQCNCQKLLKLRETVF